MPKRTFYHCLVDLMIRLISFTDESILACPSLYSTFASFSLVEVFVCPLSLEYINRLSVSLKWQKAFVMLGYINGGAMDIMAYQGLSDDQGLSYSKQLWLLSCCRRFEKCSVVPLAVIIMLESKTDIAFVEQCRLQFSTKTESGAVFFPVKNWYWAYLFVFFLTFDHVHINNDLTFNVSSERLHFFYPSQQKSILTSDWQIWTV